MRFAVVIKKRITLLKRAILFLTVVLCVDIRVMRISLDELAAGRNLVAHQHREDAVGFGGVLDVHLAQDARVGVHRRLPQLVGVHLAETFVTLDVHALAELG